MEISLIGRSQVKPCRVHLAYRENGFCDLSSNNLDCWRSNLICSGQTIQRPGSSVRLKVQASSTVHSEAVVSDSVSGDRKPKPMTAAGVMLFVGLPLDCVSDCNTINHARAIAAGLKALKLLGVDGVELPVWWGIAEKEVMGKYNWTGYLVLAELVEKMGLQLHISLCFHASKEPRIPLPEWVSRIGESQPGIFFTDRSGQHYKDCLSVGVDDLPLLEGRTPIQVYKEFCETFKDSFSYFLGYTIKSISIGLGPDGELRYPSHQNSSESKRSIGVGEFQCYDERMLTNLKQYAEAHQSPLWGLSGPHDAASYHQSPILSNFFKEHGGSWETPYGDFFLSWYSRQLLSHGDCLLSLAASTFCDTGVTVSGKVPLVHSWYRTRSHPSELMAGFYNTANRDGYEAFVKMFARNSCKMMLSGMNLSDEYQPQESFSSPELLLAQISTACRKHGVEVYGQNSLNVGVNEGGFEKIKKNLVGENAMVRLFTYQRMGAYFFSPEHFPSFSLFVRDLKQRALHSDDLMLDVEQTTKTSASMDLNMQTA